MVEDVLVAAGEACTNAIEHGHRDDPGGLIRLRAAVTAGFLRLTVVDTGRWKPPQPRADSARGRGISIMRAITHQVTVADGAAGTTVDLRWKIPR